MATNNNNNAFSRGGEQTPVWKRALRLFDEKVQPFLARRKDEQHRCAAAAAAVPPATSSSPQ
jgi:hypothetical protein